MNRGACKAGGLAVKAFSCSTCRVIVLDEKSVFTPCVIYAAGESDSGKTMQKLRPFTDSTLLYMSLPLYTRFLETVLSNDNSHRTCVYNSVEYNNPIKFKLWMEPHERVPRTMANAQPIGGPLFGQARSL